MRTPNEITHNGKTLTAILAEHKTWLTTDTDDGRADLSGADLSGADLSGADLSSANLSGADLSSANLSGADLSDTNLSGADLSSANLRGANLSGADLRGANLRGAKSILSIGPCGSRESIMYAVQHEQSVMVQCGCFWGTLDEFHNAVKKEHGESKHAKVYFTAIDLILAYFAKE